PGGRRRPKLTRPASRESGTTRRKLILEAQEIEEIEAAALIAVGVRLTGREPILEAQEVEEIESAALVAVGVAAAEHGVDRRDIGRVHDQVAGDIGREVEADGLGGVGPRGFAVGDEGVADELIADVLAVGGVDSAVGAVGSKAGGHAAGAGDIEAAVAGGVGAVDSGAEEVVVSGEAQPGLVDGDEAGGAVELARDRIDGQAVGPVADVDAVEVAIPVVVAEDLDDRVGA